MCTVLYTEICANATPDVNCLVLVKQGFRSYSPVPSSPANSDSQDSGAADFDPDGDDGFMDIMHMEAGEVSTCVPISIRPIHGSFCLLSLLSASEAWDTCVQCTVHFGGSTSS